MANTATKKKTATTAKKTTAKVKEEPKEEPKKLIPKDIDDSQYVTVRNGFQGRLVYVSRRTGEEFIWEWFGDEQEMQLRELKNAKSSEKRFFTDNWFMFDEDWIIDYLGMRKFYENSIGIDSFDEIFSYKPDELEETINNLSNGQKQSVAYRAKQLISEGKIDSLSVISTLEKLLNIDLIEK